LWCRRLACAGRRAAETAAPQIRALLNEDRTTFLAQALRSKTGEALNRRLQNLPYAINRRSMNDNEMLNAELLDLLAGGRKTEAIKRYREATD
jgi:hypothetical protein